MVFSPLPTYLKDTIFCYFRFFSLGVSWGGLMMFGSYNKFNNKINLGKAKVPFTECTYFDFWTDFYKLKFFFRCWFRLILGFLHLNHCFRGHFLRPRILVRAIGRRHQRRGRRWTRFGLHCLPNGLGKIALARTLVNFVLCHVVFLGTWFRICLAWNCVDRNVWWLSQIEKSQGKKITLEF